MDTSVSFASLGLAEPLLRAVTNAGYTEPTPIQARAIPEVLKGGDLLAAAQTGTGKTAGFALPILHHLLRVAPAARRPGRPRSLILTPTRELAAQVAESVRLYGQLTSIRSLVIFGGVNINPQISALRKPVDILIATPGRLLDHARQKTLDLSGVEILVLDEADRMLDMGFIHDIRRVLALLPKTRQNLLFSATFSDEIRTLSRTVLNNPEEISVARRNAPSDLVAQQVVLTDQASKRDLLSFIIRESGWHQVLVFTRTKHGANRLAEKLSKDGLAVAAIHGNKSQGARTRALNGFKEGKVAVLVATDIAARGLDIDHLPHVVNFELPNVPEDYVHRIGRTGRAGVEGAALSLVDPTEMKSLAAIERLLRTPIERTTFAGWTPPRIAAGAPRHDDAPVARRAAYKANGGGTSGRAQQTRHTIGRAAPRHADDTGRYADGAARRADGAGRRVGGPGVGGPGQYADGSGRRTNGAGQRTPRRAGKPGQVATRRGAPTQRPALLHK